MLWRKRVIQILVYSVVVGLVGLFVAYHVVTNPIATRQIILQALANKFPGAQAHLDFARLNILDGLTATELRMGRRDDLDRSDFLHVPSATIFMEKEQFMEGKLLLRKIVLHRPQIRVVIDRNGTCNLSGIMAPCMDGERIPTIILKQANITFEDHRLGANRPVVEIQDFNATLSNDPLTQVHIESHGRTDILGPIRFHAEYNLEDKTAQANIELSAISTGGGLIQRLADFAPNVAAHFRQFQATSQLNAHVTWQPNSPAPLGFHLAYKLVEGQLTHARLPFTLEKMQGEIKLVNDSPAGGNYKVGEIPKIASLINLRIPEGQFSTQSGPSRISAQVKDLLIGGVDETGLANSPLRAFANGSDDLPVSELKWVAEHLQVHSELFRYLPDSLADLNSDLKPSGPVTVAHTYLRPRPGSWSKNYHITPEGMEAEFFKFPYPLNSITGTIDRNLSSDGIHRIDLDLNGKAGDRPIVVKGSIDGPRETSAVDLKLNVENVPLDERLHRALPPKCQNIANQFHPKGLANVKADIRRQRGQHGFNNSYYIYFHDSSMNYDLFPYPLEEVTGNLDVHDDHWECRNFKGHHKGSMIEFAGRSIPERIQADSAIRTVIPEKMHLAIRGTSLKLNNEFETAISSPKTPGRSALAKTWKTLLPSGTLDFYAEVIDVNDHPKDLDVKVAVKSCCVRPRFFDYALNEVSARVNYSHDRIDLFDIQASHGGSRILLPRGNVQLHGDDGYHVQIPEIIAENIKPDQDFLNAMPYALKKGLASVRLDGPFSLKTSLDVDQKEGNPAASIRWDGIARFKDNSLHAGLEVKDIKGGVSSQGFYDGQQISQLNGILMLDHAKLLGQELKHVRANLMVKNDSPNTLRFYNVNSEFYGGRVGAEAQVTFGPQFSYSVHMLGTEIQLEQFGKHNFGSASDMSGPARFGLFVHGSGSELNEIEGDGTVDIPSGKLYRLPPLLDLLKAFGLRRPDQTAFEQAHLKFDIKGGKFHFSDLDLIGNAISLRGKGNVNLDGSNVMLDFNADWGRLNQVLPAAVQVIPQFVSDQLFMIKVRGKIGEMKFEKELVPAVTEPIRKAINRNP